jgi:hypothetical protein
VGQWAGGPQDPPPRVSGPAGPRTPPRGSEGQRALGPLFFYPEGKEGDRETQRTQVNKRDDIPNPNRGQMFKAPEEII